MRRSVVDKVGVSGACPSWVRPKPYIHAIEGFLRGNRSKSHCRLSKLNCQVLAVGVISILNFPQ